MLIGLSSCVRKGIVLESSDLIYKDKAGIGICKDTAFDCVVMSQGKLRELTY